MLGLRRVLKVHVLMKSNPSPRNKTKHRSLKAPMLVPPSFCCTAVQPRWPLATSPNSQPALPLEMLRYSHELLIPDLGQHSVDGRNRKKNSWSAFQTTIYKHLCFMYTVIFTKYKLIFIRNSRQFHLPAKLNRQVLPSPYSKICRPSRPCSSCCGESRRWVTLDSPHEWGGIHNQIHATSFGW